MTRPGDASERRRRIRLGYTPGADGTLHSPQPVEPEGRRKRRKASGHKHTEGQPTEDHGPEHDADGSDPNPHTGSTANPHAVTHSQAGAPTGNPHAVTHAETNPPQTNPHNVTAAQTGAAADPHGDEAHSKQTVENLVGSPSRSRNTRANQPAPGNVEVGSEYRVRDEGDILEIATDTDDDGVADSWIEPTATHDHPGLATDPHDDTQHSRDYDADFVNASGDVMSGPLRIDEGGIGEVRLDHDADSTRNAGNVHVRDSNGNATSVFIFGADDPNNPDAVRVAATRLQVGTDDVWHEGNFDPASKAADPHGDASHSRDYDADFVNIGGDTMSGPIRVDRGGVGQTTFTHTSDSTRNTGALQVYDDSGNSVTVTIFGPAESNPRIVFSEEIEINHGDVTLNGGDLIANKSSHGGNIVAQGWIEAKESVQAQTFLYAAGEYRTSKEGTASDPAIWLGVGSTATSPEAGIYQSTTAGGDSRLAIAGDSASIAVFDPSGSKFLHAASDAGANLGTTNIRWDGVYCYTLDEASDPALKTDMHPVTAADAVRRVRDTAGAAISFRWRDGGRRTHLGFDADKVGLAHGDESAAFADPAVNGDEGRDPTEGERAAPSKSIRPFELIADLYVAVAALTDRVTELEAA